MKNKSKYVIIGAGIHGLSTAYHLALNLKKQGKGSGEDIIIIDKSDVGAGASGIACGVVRNNYYQSAMRELMQQSVEVWESDAEAYSYNPVGYMQINTSFMTENIAQIAQEQKNIGYTSEFIQGKAACDKYMKNIFSDWQAQDIDSILHEKKGGYANNMQSLTGLANKAKSQGVEIIGSVTVNGFKLSGSHSIEEVQTDKGNIACDYVIVTPGPWAGQFWEMLSLPQKIEVNNNGKIVQDVPMWTYWCLQEGTLNVPPDSFKTDDGSMPPVIHVDSDIPLTLENGETGPDVWGIYYKPDFCFNGVQGGSAPFIIDEPYNQVAVDPYGIKSQKYTVKESFVQLWLAGLAHCHKRFENVSHLYNREPSGGIGCFTPDNFPVFDTFKDNCYMILDSNHGYKMIGIGKLVAEEIVNGTKSTLLKPFRFSRYEEGNLIPTSNSPFPWS